MDLLDLITCELTFEVIGMPGNGIYNYTSATVMNDINNRNNRSEVDNVINQSAD